MEATRRFLGVATVLLLGVLWAAGITHGGQRGEERGPRTGCLFVQVCEFATNKPVAYANVFAIGRKTGGLSDTLGRCSVCMLAEGTVAIRTSAPGFYPRLDTVAVHRNRTDTLRVRLRRVRINAGETLLIAPRHGSNGRKP